LGVKELMASLNHIHTYIRRTGSDKLSWRESTFKCADVHCTQIALAIDLEGKASICAKCGLNEIVLDYEQLKLARPRCTECSMSRKDKERIEAKKKLEEMGIL